MTDTARSRRWLKLLWAGIGLLLVGELIDFRWHSTHDANVAFESFTTQVQAHLVIWIATAFVLVIAGLVLRTSYRNRAYALIFIGAFADALASVWPGTSTSMPPILPCLTSCWP